MAVRKTFRWIVLVVVAIVVGLAIVLAGIVVETGDEGTSDLEIYIGEQIRGVVNDYLKPQIEFSNPDYQAPKTVVIDNVRITSRDPMRDNRVVDIVRIRKATIELGEIPEVGKPLLIERVKLEKPELRLLAVGPDDNSLIGFSNLLKETATTETSPSTSNTKLTDVFHIRLIELVDGIVEFDTRNPDVEPMRLDNIQTRLTIEPDDTGWYSLKTNIAREPIFSMDIDGRFNINDAAAKIASIQLNLDLNEQTRNTLPPQLQELLKAHQVQGQLAVKASGELKFYDLLASNLNLEADLRKGFMTFQEYRVKIDKMLATVELKDEKINVKHFETRALDGVLFIEGNIELSGSYNADFKVEADSLHLAQLDRVYVEAQQGRTAPPKPEQGNKPSPLRGVLEAKLEIQTRLQHWSNAIHGNGTITLKDGRLIRVAVLKELEATISKAVELISQSKPSDQLHLEFELKGDHAHFSKIDMRTPAIAVRGKGDVFLDGRLDLALNGGPLEKVQSVLGPFGEVTAFITDNLAKYIVKGTMDDPDVSVKVAPGLFDKLIPKFN